MTSIVTLTSGEALRTNCYNDTSDKLHLSIFLTDGTHRKVPVSDVVSVDKIKESRAMTIFDLPIARSMWREDARDLRA